MQRAKNNVQREQKRHGEEQKAGGDVAKNVVPEFVADDE